jgi:hypothetical protein
VFVQYSGFALAAARGEVVLLAWPIVGFDEGFKVVCGQRSGIELEFLF